MERQPYLVGLVVVLWVVLEQSLLLWILPCRQYLVQLCVFPPLLAVDEPVCLSTSSPVSAPCLVIVRGSHIFSARATSNLRARRNRNCNLLLATALLGVERAGWCIPVSGCPDGPCSQQTRASNVALAPPSSACRPSGPGGRWPCWER